MCPFVQNEHHTLLIPSEIALRWIKIPAAPFIELWNISVRCAAVWTWTNLKGRSSTKELKIVLLQAVCLSIKYSLLIQDSEEGIILREKWCYWTEHRLLTVYYRCMEITEDYYTNSVWRNLMSKCYVMVLTTLHAVLSTMQKQKTGWWFKSSW